ncbi:MAG TPA: cupin domain-containing protein [Burkholderiaceae bacterium]|nr:cupin domain-containing protein [Burkholderiaceae bacterium]
MVKPLWAASTLVAALVLANPLAAQQSAPASPSAAPNVKRIPLQRFDVPGTAFEAVIGIAEIAPSVAIGRHTHPGPESGYVIEGGFELLIDGEPPRLLKAGDSYKVPPGAIHDAKAGPQGAKVIATYVVEKGQPLAAAAPAAPQ